MLSNGMLLNDRQIMRLNEFLGNFGLIEELGAYDLLIRTKFGISRQDEYVYILIPHQDGYKAEFVQYTIKIMEEII